MNMVTDFMKEATKSFCVPLDIDTECPSPSSLPPPINYIPSYEQEDGTMDCGEAKFLLTSTWTFCYKRRNRIPRIPLHNDITIIQQSKPVSLRRLNDDLYCNLILDLQSTLRYRSGWILLFWLPVCICAAFSSLVFMFHSRSESRENSAANDSQSNSPNHDRASWHTIFIIVIVSFILCKILYRIKLRSIEDELHIRVHYEWLPLLERHGFAINYVIDDPGKFYSRKETYIHIYRINYGGASNVVASGGFPDTINITRKNSLLSETGGAVALAPSQFVPKNTVTTGTKQSIPEEGNFNNEAKYLVFYPMELARRNVDARQLGYSYLSTSSVSICTSKDKYYCALGCDDTNVDDQDDIDRVVCYYVKPPLLRDLPDNEEGLLLLHDFLYDIEILTSPSYTARMTLFVISFILFILLCVSAMARHEMHSSNKNHVTAEYYQSNFDGCFALFGFLLLIYICDRFLRIYTNVYCGYYNVANIVVKWLPRFRSYGYNVTYHVDQPHWYSFREDYVHIYKSNNVQATHMKL